MLHALTRPRALTVPERTHRRRGGRPVDGGVGELLGERPVHPGEVGAGDHRVVQLHLEFEVERPRPPRPQVRVGLGVLRRRVDEMRPQRVERDDPRRDAAGEALAQERPERLVLVALDVARRPVVQQHRAEHVAIGVVGRMCATAVPMNATSSSKSSAALGLRRSSSSGVVVRPHGGGRRCHATIVPDRPW